MDKRVRADKRLREWLSATGINQSDLSEKIGVTRAAVSKWASGATVPSEENARCIDILSQGAVPATIWPRRKAEEPPTTGAAVILSAAEAYGGSITRLARENGLPQRSMVRWAVGQTKPRASALAELNAALRTNLKPRDFEVMA